MSGEVLFFTSGFFCLVPVVVITSHTVTYNPGSIGFAVIESGTAHSLIPRLSAGRLFSPTSRTRHRTTYSLTAYPPETVAVKFYLMC